jgi:hypothetical protein
VAPDIGELEITTQGLLPLTIGEPAQTNPGALMIRFEEDHCYSEEFGITDGDLDRWLADYGSPDEGGPFTLAVDGDGDVFRIDVWDSAIATPEGIHIGSTLGELMDVYPVELQSGSGYSPTSAVWWIEDAHGIVVFESQNPDDYEASPDNEDQIILIRVLESGSDPDWAAANSGNVAGACPF